MDLTVSGGSVQRRINKREVALKVLIVAAALQLSRRLWRRFTNKQQYDGLDGVVSFSSRIIAACRCLESEEQNPLFTDPLARTLAGERAMARAGKRAEATIVPEEEREPGKLHRQRKIGRIALRTVWFDEQLLAALSHSHHPQPLSVKLSAENEVVKLAATANDVPRQVVLLGAGMDTRAWRLKLPEGVKWFEVDRMDVLSAKAKAMSQAGASFNPCDAIKGSATGHQSGEHYPLQTASYAAVEADLERQGFTDALAAKGWSRHAPTVWLAEPQAALSMLGELSGASAPGSVLLAISVTEAVIESIRAKRSQGELLNHFVFGCPIDPRPMLEGVGWNLLACEIREDMIKASGLPRRLFTDMGTPSQGYNSLFVVAVPRI